jgi:uncharacterized protein with PQ loop repeat
MNDFLVNLGTMVAIFSALGFIIGCFMIFSEKDRKIGLKFMVFSTIAFIIGFGTCVANFALDTR